MSDDTRQETQPAGCSLQVTAYGDTMSELEMAALGEARAFFGESRRLTVVPGYRAFAHAADQAAMERAGGKRYHAEVTVRIIEPE